MKIFIYLVIVFILNIKMALAGIFIVNHSSDLLNPILVDIKDLVDRYGNERVSLVNDNCHRQAFKVSLTANQVGSSGGFSKQLKLDDSFSQLYLTFTVKFGDNFGFASSKETGKLLGLSGGNNSTNTGGVNNPEDRNRGWSARVNWRENGKISVYVYHLNQSTTDGDDFKLNLSNDYFVAGKSYTITLLVKLNSIGHKNGILKLWVDGELKASYSEIEFQSSEENSGPIERIALSTFLGGGSDFAHRQQEDISISNITLNQEYSDKTYAIDRNNCLMTWAEKSYPNYFSPSGGETNQVEGYLTRYYKQTNTYLGTKDKNVYVFGEVFGEGIINAGIIADYIK